MRTIFIGLITLLISMSLLQAESLQATVNAQAIEIKQLKRALSLKEQELKILLITVKNSKQESMLHTNQQHLEFKDVNNVSATRVVIKPSMLSETAIKEIDHAGDTDTDALDDTLSGSDTSGETQAGTTDTMKAQSMEDTKSVTVKKELPQKEMMKEEKTAEIAMDEKQVIPALTRMKPSTFSLIKDTKVFKKIFTKEGDAWREGMRFTSNKRRGKWIQITGKITDQGWQQVGSELWIEQSYVKKIR